LLNIPDYQTLRPSDKTSIDRIDPNQDYSPENCRWSDDKEQGRTRRSTIKLSYKGEFYELPELCEILGVKISAIYAQRQKHPEWTGDDFFEYFSKKKR